MNSYVRGRNSSQPPPSPPPLPPPPNNRRPHHRHRRRHCRRHNHHHNRRRRHHHHHHYDHHLAKIELGHLFAHSSLTLLEVSIMVSSGFFCLWSVVFLLSSVIYYWAFCLYVATSFFFFSVYCPKLGLHLFPSQSRCLFYSLSKSILLYFSDISSLLCYSSRVSCFNGTLLTTAGRASVSVLHSFILFFLSSSLWSVIFK